MRHFSSEGLTLYKRDPVVSIVYGFPRTRSGFRVLLISQRGWVGLGFAYYLGNEYNGMLLLYRASYFTRKIHNYLLFPFYSFLFFEIVILEFFFFLSYSLSNE